MALASNHLQNAVNDKNEIIYCSNIANYQTHYSSEIKEITKSDSTFKLSILYSINPIIKRAIDR